MGEVLELNELNYTGYTETTSLTITYLFEFGDQTPFIRMSLSSILGIVGERYNDLCDVVK